MKNTIIVAIVLFSWNSYSQKGQAEKPTDKFAYVDPVGTYERIAAKGYKAPKDMLLKVANACYFRSDLVSAAKWYKELFDAIPEQEAEVYYRYAQSLKAIKEYTKADEMMALFLKKRN